VLGRILPSVAVAAVIAVVAATYRRAAVMVAMGKVMICIPTQFLDPG